ncbi:MAG: TlpA family protein disulfide reductase [Bryobacteraceae bacterium]|nr:TlpA family protein disulfide reductase [Bryobacteraceae bacterium]
MDEEWIQNQLATLRPPKDWEPDQQRAWTRLQRRPQRPSAAYAVAFAAVMATLLALPATRAWAGRCADACVAGTSAILGLTTVSSGTAVQRYAAPGFRLPDADGIQIDLHSMRGKVVLLNFWATWCQPCLTEIPWFVDLQQQYRQKGLMVLGVSLDEGGWKSVRPFLLQNQLNYPVMLGNGELAKAYGVESLPVTLLIDKAGRIVARHTGLATKNMHEDEIKRLLAE